MPAKPRTPSQDDRIIESARTRKIAALSLGLFSLVVYVSTLYPTVAGGDSGELVTVADTLGIAHPPGYPLFSLLGFLFTRIPWGTVAWRVNLLSAFCDAAAAVFLFFAVVRLSRRLSAGLLAGGLFAFSPLIWRYAIQAEVFALNNFFCAALFWILVEYAESRRQWLAELAAFTLGLGLCNHHLLILYGGPFLLAILILGRQQLWQPRVLGRMVVFGSVGLLPYLYLPLAAAHHPVIAWGDLSTLSGFLDHLLRRDYGTFQLHAGPSENSDGFFSRLGLYLFSLPGEMLGVGFLLALYGLAPGRKSFPRGIRIAIGAALALYLFVFNSLSNIDLNDVLAVGVQARFWQQPNLLLFAAMGMGWARVPLKPVWATPLVLLAVATQLGIHYGAVNQRGNHLLEDYGRAMLEPLPPDAILVTQGDLCLSTARYWQIAQHARADVAIIHENLMSYSWYRPQVEARIPGIFIPPPAYVPGPAVALSLRPFLDANSGKHRIFICNEGLPGDDPDRAAAYQTVPWGLTDEAVPMGHEIPDGYNLQSWLEANQAALALFPAVAASPYPADSWERNAVLHYWKHRSEVVDYVMHAAQRTPQEDLYLLSAALLDDIVRNFPEAPVSAYKNLGAIYAQAAKFNPVHQKLAIEAWKQFISRSPASDPDANKLRQLLGM